MPIGINMRFRKIKFKKKEHQTLNNFSIENMYKIYNN